MFVMESMTRQWWWRWLTVEALARWFHRLKDYPSSLKGDEEGGWGYPPSEGRKARWDGSGGYRERRVEKSTNMADAKLMLNTLWGEFGHPINMTGTWQRRDTMRW